MAELKNVVVDAISLVKAGANGEPIQIYKSAEAPASDPSQAADTTATSGEPVQKADEPETLPEAPATDTGEGETAPAAAEATAEGEVERQAEAKAFSKLKELFTPIIKAFTGQGESVEKAADINNSFDPASFTSRMTQPEARLDEAVYQLMYSFWHIFWNDNIENGREMILKNIDDFKAYVTSVLDGPRDQAEAFFEKGEETEMKVEDIKKAVDEALAPVAKSLGELTAKIEGIEKAETPAEETPAAETPAAEGTPETTEVQKSEAEILAEAVSAAVAPLAKSIDEMGKRVERIETTKGISRSAGDPKAQVEKAVTPEDPWADIHIPGIG